MSKIIPPNSADKKNALRSTVHPADVIKDIKAKDLEGTNLLFINMPLRESARPNTTPEGPLLLATRLRQQYGVEKTSIIDLNGYRRQDEEARQRGLINGRHLNNEEVFG